MRRIAPILLLLLAASIVIALGSTACRAPSAAALEASPAGVSPVSEKEGFEMERFEHATSGLHFETPSGLVEVERIVTGSRLTAAAHLQRGDELLALNREMDALLEYGLAARNDPESTAAYVGIGGVLKRKGKLVPALTAYRTAVDRDGRDPAARFELALALWTASRQDEAVAEMRAVLDLDDDYGRAHERLAVWSYYRGEHDAARQHLQRAQALGQAVPAQLSGLLDEVSP